MMAETSETIPLLYMRRGKNPGCGPDFWRCLIAYVIILIIAVTAAVFLTIYIREGISCPACWQTGPLKGIVSLQPDNGSQIKGTLMLNQGNTTQPVEITGVISGLNPKSVYDLTVQPIGNLAEGCSSAMILPKDNTTLNMVLKYHDPFKDISSFGNHWPKFTTDADGSISVYIMDTILSLCGEHSIVGRTILVLEVGEQDSVPIGCGLVGYIPA